MIVCRIAKIVLPLNCFFNPAGNVITGNFEIINDTRLRSLLNKGSKYRIPSLIDFNYSRGQIAEVLQYIRTKWCRSEQE